MASLSVSAFDAMMKEIYPKLRVETLAIKNRPFLEWVPKYDEFYGDALVVPVLYEDPQSRSVSLATAIANAETSKQEKFVLTARKKDYGAVKIDAEAIIASSKDVGSFIRGKETQITGMIRQLGKSLHLALYRSGTGSIGVIATGGVSTVTVTLTNKSDVHNFGVGQYVVANNTDDGVSVKTRSQVAGRNVSAGTLTMADDVSAFGGGNAWAAGDFLFTEGDTAGKLVGLAGWIPLAAPTASAFFGVDRTKDATRLGGQRVDNSARSILENAEEIAMLVGEEGGTPDALFMNPRAGLILSEQVGAKVERMEGGKPNLGFRGFTIVNFITGPLDVIFDIGCPPDRAYLLQRDTWRLEHMEGLPHLVRDDGRDSARGATTDDIEVRCRYFAELACRAPGYNGVFSVATS